jgi:hypothetical protein
MRRRPLLSTLPLLALCATAAAQGGPAYAFLPPANQLQEASGRASLPAQGARAQYVMDNVPAGVIDQLTLRVDAEAGATGAGALDLTIRVGALTGAAADVSTTFAHNLNSGALVFSGAVSLPATSTAPGADPWASDRVVQVDFAASYAHPGGGLCVQIDGGASTGDAWLPVDAHEAGAVGARLNLGGGCGPWAGDGAVGLSTKGAVVGGSAEFLACGTPSTFSLALVGEPAAAPLPLDALGMTGCSLQVTLPTLAIAPVWMAAPNAHGVGFGRYALPIPNLPALQGAALAVQWFHMPLPAAGPHGTLSDAMSMTIGPAPASGYRTVLGEQANATGSIYPTVPVMRLRYL